MRNRLIVGLALAIFFALTWTGCSSDGYTGTARVYVGHGYAGRHRPASRHPGHSGRRTVLSPSLTP